MKIYSPVSGKVVGIEKIKDPVFSEKMIGDGAAIDPDSRVICAPVEGILSSIYPTNHAFVIETKEDKKVLVHIGLETVSLQGRPFRRLREAGMEVKTGDPVVEFDRGCAEAEGIDPSVIVVVEDSVTLGRARDGEMVCVGDVLFEVRVSNINSDGCV